MPSTQEQRHVYYDRDLKLKRITWAVLFRSFRIISTNFMFWVLLKEESGICGARVRNGRQPAI